MFYQVRIWKGLTTPYVSAHQLNKAEKYDGVWKWTTIFLLITLALSGISAFLGIGSGQLSKLIYETSPSEFQAAKGLFAVGQILQSLLVTVILIFFSALVFWVFTDIEYRKLMVVQLFVICIHLIEKLIAIPLHFYFGLDNISSPFSLGVIAQYLTDYEILINFLGEISLFSIWTMILQYKFLRIITEVSNRRLYILIISINLFFWIFSALFTYIKFEVFL